MKNQPRLRNALGALSLFVAIFSAVLFDYMPGHHWIPATLAILAGLGASTVHFQRQWEECELKEEAALVPAVAVIDVNAEAEFIEVADYSLGRFYDYEHLGQKVEWSEANRYSLVMEHFTIKPVAPARTIVDDVVDIVKRLSEQEPCEFILTKNGDFKIVPLRLNQASETSPVDEPSQSTLRLPN